MRYLLLFLTLILISCSSEESSSSGNSEDKNNSSSAFESIAFIDISNADLLLTANTSALNTNTIQIKNSDSTTDSGDLGYLSGDQFVSIESSHSDWDSQLFQVTEHYGYAVVKRVSETSSLTSDSFTVKNTEEETIQRLIIRKSDGKVVELDDDPEKLSPNMSDSLYIFDNSNDLLYIDSETKTVKVIDFENQTVDTYLNKEVETFSMSGDLITYSIQEEDGSYSIIGIDSNGSETKFNTNMFIGEKINDRCYFGLRSSGSENKNLFCWNGSSFENYAVINQDSLVQEITTVSDGMKIFENIVVTNQGAVYVFDKNPTLDNSTPNTEVYIMSLFGFGCSANANLLDLVASETDGEYSYVSCEMSQLGGFREFEGQYIFHFFKIDDQSYGRIAIQDHGINALKLVDGELYFKGSRYDNGSQVSGRIVNPNSTDGIQFQELDLEFIF
jgi:hypothetical protein